MVRVDPFAIFALGAMLTLVGFLGFLGYKFISHIRRRARYEADADARSMSKIVLDPEGPQRVFSILSARESLPPHARHPKLAALVVAAAVLTVGYFLVGPFVTTFLTDQIVMPEPTEQEFSVVVEPYDLRYYYNLSWCPNRTVTTVYGLSGRVPVQLYLDAEWRHVNATRTAWEFTIKLSAVCTSNAVYTLISARDVGGAG